MRLSASFNGTDSKLIGAFEQRGPRFISLMTDRLNRTAIMLQQHVVGDKLQGQVLNHRSGKLAASIRVISAHTEGASLVSQVEGAGGVAWYGRIHEYGGTFTFLRSNKRRHVGTYVVVTYPERSFMRTSLEDMRSQILAELRGAAMEALS